jgi:cell division protein FtsZ
VAATGPGFPAHATAGKGENRSDLNFESGSKSVVVVWCSLSRESSWVNNEARLAKNLGKFLPIVIENIDLPLEFNGDHSLDLTSWDGGPRSHLLDPLLDELARLVGRDPLAQHRKLQAYENDWRRFGEKNLKDFALDRSKAILKARLQGPREMRRSPEIFDLAKGVPRIVMLGVGGSGCNSVNNMIASGLSGVKFIVARIDANTLSASKAELIIEMKRNVVEVLSSDPHPEVGRAAAEDAIEVIRDRLRGAHMCFVAAGMGGSTGSGAAPVIARAARDLGILTVGVVSMPFHFEGTSRMRTAESCIEDLIRNVDTLIVIPNQNLFRVATEHTTFADAFAIADQVLYSMVTWMSLILTKKGIVEIDFADLRSIIFEMGMAKMGCGESGGLNRAVEAAELALTNPIFSELSIKDARGLLISIFGPEDMTVNEIDEAANRIRREVNMKTIVVISALFNEKRTDAVQVCFMATGIAGLQR